AYLWIFRRQSTAAERILGQALGIETREDLAQLGLVDKSGRLGGAEPFQPALALFGEILPHLLDPDRIDRDDAGQFAAGAEHLRIGIEPEAVLDQLAFDARLLEGLAPRALAARQALDRPALGDDPAAGVAAGDQQDLGAALAVTAIAEGAVLRDRLFCVDRKTVCAF